MLRTTALCGLLLLNIGPVRARTSQNTVPTTARDTLAARVQKGGLQSTVEVERAYEGRIAPATLPAEEAAVPDSLQRFSTLVDYRIFDKPYQDVFRFDPLPAARPQAGVPEAAPLFYARASLAYPLAPSLQASFQPRLAPAHALSVTGHHRSFWGTVPMVDPRVGDALSPAWVIPDKVAAPESRTGLRAAWSYRGQRVHLQAQAAWTQGYNALYGHDPHELALRKGFMRFEPYTGARFFHDSLSRHFHRAGFRVSARSARPLEPGLSFRIEARGDYTLDRAQMYMHKLDPRELVLDLDGLLAYRMDKGFQIGLDWGIHAQNAPFDSRLDYKQFSVSPFVHWNLRGLDLTAGFKLLASNLPDYLFTPRLDLRYPVIKEKLWVYGRVTGDKGWDSYGQWLDYCPYLNPDARVALTSTPWDLQAGALFRPGETWTAELFTGYIKHNVFGFLGAASNTQANFMSLQYHGLRDFHAGARMHYRHLRFQAQAEAHWHHYQRPDATEVWHLPAFEAGLQARYAFRDRLDLSLDAYWRGKAYAPVWLKENLPSSELGKPVFQMGELNPYLNLNLTALYRLTSRLSVFVEIRNLLGSKQQDFMLYRKPGTGLGLGASLRL